jgi:hypothetical protein
MARSKLSDSERVKIHIQSLDKSTAEAMSFIRYVFLSSDGDIAEQIKWNSPSFYYKGEMKPFDPKEYKRDIAVANLHRGKLMLVFPTGAKVDDQSGFLEGDYADGRRIVNFMNEEDVREKEENLRKVIRDWLNKVEK